MTDPIEQLAAELRELWQDSDLPSSELVAKLIKVAAEATATHCYECNATETFDECAEEPSCMADISQRIREGMGK